MNLPHIAITSHLPDGLELREECFLAHFEQRTILRDMFPSLTIRSYCSGYKARELRTLEQNDFEVGQNWKDRTHKFEKHKLILSRLYKSESPQAILLLDDDVVPTPIELFPAIDPFRILETWLKQPHDIPAPCIFFSCKDLVQDVYYAKRTTALIHSPLKVAGWAILVRNDLGVMLEAEDLLYGQNQIHPSDDLAFRCKCAAEGKLVLKHQLLFFKTFQPKRNGRSRLVRNHAERVYALKDHQRQIAERYPHLFSLTPQGNLKAVWTVPQSRRSALLTIGALRATPFGDAPVPEKLKEIHRAKRKREGKRGFLREGDC